MQDHSIDLFGQPISEDRFCTKCQTRKPLDQFCWRKDKFRKRLHNWCNDCKAQNSKKWHAKNGLKYKDTRLKRTYGITLAEYETMLQNQNHACACCKKPETKNIDPRTGKSRRLCVDHAHDGSKRVRGLLCNRCNRAIGNFQDDSELLRLAADYLDTSR